ncbi:hypothetical protein CB1_007889009 [Camelus ferus]|nr:hypothetical protein CB1_007889009 [Camelus ferus]
MDHLWNSPEEPCPRSCPWVKSSYSFLLAQPSAQASAFAIALSNEIQRHILRDLVALNAMSVLQFLPQPFGQSIKCFLVAAAHDTGKTSHSIQQHFSAAERDRLTLQATQVLLNMLLKGDVSTLLASLTQELSPVPSEAAQQHQQKPMNGGQC